MTTQNGEALLLQGRLVYGANLFEGTQKKDFNTNQPVFDEAGNPKMEYGFGLAVPKIDPATGQPSAEFTKIWNALHTQAFTLYPSGTLPPDFALKCKDGDGIDHKGQKFSERTGYAGHIIINCTTQIPIKWFKWENNQNVMVVNGIKVGDYVNVQLNIKAHPAKGKGKAGLYVNPGSVQLIQEGEAIVNSPSGDQIFGAAQPAAYAGQVVAPTTPTAAPVMNPVQPVVAPIVHQPVAPVVAPVVAPAHYDVIPQQHQPVAPVVAPIVHQPVAQAIPVAPPMPTM